MTYGDTEYVKLKFADMMSVNIQDIISSHLAVPYSDYKIKFATIPVDNRTVADILDALADKFESNALVWVQGQYTYGIDSVCLVGGLQREANVRTSVGQTVIYHDTVEYLRNYMKEHGYFDGSGHLHMEEWNDTRGREKFEVVALLRQAAKEWRSDHDVESG